MEYSTKITGVGSYLPSKKISNFDLEKILDTSDEWIFQRTGIKERRWVEGNTTTCDLAYEASKEAFNDAEVNENEIDGIIFATLSPDHTFPGTGVFLQEKLDLPNCPIFDIRQQCSGFLYGMEMGRYFIGSGNYKKILLVGAESQSQYLDKTPRGRNMSVLFGDGAGAVILERTQIKDKDLDSHILTTNLHAEGKKAHELWMPKIKNFSSSSEDVFPFMHGNTIFINAIKKMVESLKLSCEQVKITPDDIDCFLFHQANMRINSKVAEVLGVDKKKIFNTIEKYGNTTAATIPIGMKDALKSGFLQRGMLVASATFGSGFTWASAIYRF